MSGPERIDRRTLLGGAAAAASGTLAGCITELRAAVAHSEPEQVDLTVKTLPADEDPSAVQIGRRLSEHLESAGISATTELVDEPLLFRDVLLEYDYDIFVARLPGHGDPDELRPFLHSLFSEEAGWQNPFGITSRRLDELLEDQSRQSGNARWQTVAELQEEIVSQSPFSVVVAPRHVTAATRRAVEEWELDGTVSERFYLTAGDEGLDTFRIGILGGQPTQNRNLLSAEFRNRYRVVDLLYDQLATSVGGKLIPWAAEDWEWNRRNDRLQVTLRDDLVWHDGTDLTAEDVAFTYEFLGDTALDDEDIAVPAPRFRGQTSLVENAMVTGEREVSIFLDDCSEEVGRRVLTVPILPQHRWRDRTGLVREHLTEALVDEVTDPVGSGPLQFREAVPDESVVLGRFEDHFLTRESSLPAELTPYAGGPGYETLEVVVPSSALSAVELLSEEEIHAVVTPLDPEAAAAADEADGVRLLSEPTPAYYLIGFNTRRHPLGNHQFRTAVARMFDREYISRATFGGYARPANSPLHGTRFLPASLDWNGEAAVGPFPGESGELDVERAREIFRDAGFRYGDDDELLTQQ